MPWPKKKPPSGIPASGIPARGPGWGGAASGKPAQEFDAMHQPAPEAKSAGHAEAQTAREVAKGAAAEMAALLLDVARDVTNPPQVRVDAANKIIERAEGKPAASMDITSGGVALVTAVDRPERETREQWIERRRREIAGSAVMGIPAGSAD